MMSPRRDAEVVYKVDVTCERVKECGWECIGGVVGKHSGKAVFEAERALDARCVLQHAVDDHAREIVRRAGHADVATAVQVKEHALRCSS